MKQIFILLAIVGTYPFLVGAQDSKPINQNQQTTANNKSGKKITKTSPPLSIDTIIVSSDGNTTSYFYSFSSGENDSLAMSMHSGFWNLPGLGVRRDFEQTQQQILKQVDEDANRFNRWMNEQLAIRNERILQYLKSQKVALFIEVMGLTPQESEKFWPLYNEYSEKKEEITRKRQEINTKFRRANLNIDDKTAESLSKEYVNLLMQEALLQQEYYRKYKVILKPSKLLMIYKAEDAFKLRMLQERDQLTIID